MGIVFGKINEETPNHTVLRKADGYEIWRYPSSVAATVYASSIPGNQSQNRFEESAFRILASYIGVLSEPENRKTTGGGEKIAMTAPVVMTPAQSEKIAMTAPVMTRPGGAEGSNDDTRSMSFLLPSKYETVESAPEPKNPAVKLSLMPAGRCEAVVQYSGNINMERSAERAKELMRMLERDGVEVVGDWALAGYNPPFTLPWLKRNEIHIPVKLEESEPVEQTGREAEVQSASA